MSALQELKNDIEQDVTSYMNSVNEDGEADYTQDHIDQLMVILEKFSNKAQGAKNPTEAKDIVGDTVLELNALNDKCDGALIETDQREMICSFISQAIEHTGVSTSEDLTEEWREW